MATLEELQAEAKRRAAGLTPLQRLQQEVQRRKAADPRSAVNAAIEAAKAGTLTLSPERAAQQAEIDAKGLAGMPARNDPGGVSAFVTGASQGMTFGFGDELVAAIMAASPNITYDQALQIQRQIVENANRARPKSTMAGEILGGAASSLATTGAALGYGATLAGKAGLGALAGGIEGGAYGFGTGEGGFQNRATNAAKSGALGAGVGALAPAAMAGIGMGARAIGNPVASALNIPSDVRAGRQLETYLKRAGMTADDVVAATQRAAIEGQPQFVTADALGVTGQRALAGMARQPGEARALIADALISRQDNQGSRLASLVDEALNAPKNPQKLPVPYGQNIYDNVGKTADKVTSELTAAQKKAADAAYDAARAGAGPVDVRGALAVIDDRLGGMRGSGVAGDGIDARLASYRAKLAAPASALKPGETARELSDFDRVLGLKQQIGDDIGAAQRAGRNNEARELMKVQRELDAALEAASAPYRAANDEFAAASRVIDAVETGKAATSARARAGNTVPAYQAMTTDQQSAFRAGYADPLVAVIEAAAPGVNKARPLRSDKAMAELGAMARDPEMLGRQIGRENVMFETANAALGGSKTADNLADAADSNQLSASMITNLLTGRWGALGGQTLDRFLAGASGLNPSTREMIVQALLAQDPRAAIAPAAKRAATTGRINDIASMLARSAALRIGPQ